MRKPEKTASSITLKEHSPEEKPFSCGRSYNIFNHKRNILDRMRKDAEVNDWLPNTTFVSWGRSIIQLLIIHYFPEWVYLLK